MNSMRGLLELKKKNLLSCKAEGGDGREDGERKERKEKQMKERKRKC